MATERHKLTVRLDEGEFAYLQKMCDLLGVSYTALVQALIDTTGRFAEDKEWTAPEKWPTSSSKTNFIAMTAKARDIDRRRQTNR